MIGPIGVIVIGVFIAIVFGAGFLSRRRQEARTRLLEVLARAVTTERPLPPLVTRIASELRGGIGRKADILAGRLEAGHGLADSFEAAAGLLAPRDVEAIRQAEDGPTLSPVLTELAGDAGAALTIRHRIGLALAYPALLLPLVAFSWWQLGSLAAVLPAITLPDLPTDLLVRALPFLGVMVLGAIGLLFVPGRPRPKLSFIGKATAEARLYRLAAAHLSAGRSLPDALERAAPGAGRRSVGRAALAAAERIENGEPLEGVWPWAPAAGANLADRLRRAADLRRERQRARLERRLALVHPVTVLVFAAVAFVEFRLLVEVFEQGRKAVMPW